MPDSNSKVFARRLREAVENREPLDTDEIRAEAATDEICAEMYRRQALVETAVDAVRSNPPEVDLADAVLARMVADEEAATVVSRPVDRTRFRANGWLLAVVAASIAVAVLAFVGPGRRPVEPDGAGPIADGDGVPSRPEVVEPRDDTPEELVADGDELDRLFSEATTAYRGLADGTRVAVADLGFLIPPAANVRPDAVDDEPSGGWLDGVDGGLAPVRDNVGRTLDFLFEPVPADSTAT